MKKITTEDIIYSIEFAVSIGILVYVIYLIIIQILPPSKTLYITLNYFPIEAIPQTLLFNTSPTYYIFYGTPQANGTECVSSAKIVTYIFNYTTQSLSPKPQIINVSNPKKVANLYYNVPMNFMFTIPKGHTLLCPNIINATRWS